ncbi:MAG: hypothetical protein ACFWUL_11670 [Dialister sp.]|jgi:hypothetical protein
MADRKAAPAPMALPVNRQLPQIGRPAGFQIE